MLSIIYLFPLIADTLTPLVLSSQPKLLSVNVSNNLIQEIQPGAFTNMSRLVRLILTKNKITKLDPSSLIGNYPIVVNEFSRNSPCFAVTLSRCIRYLEYPSIAKTFVATSNVDQIIATLRLSSQYSWRENVKAVNNVLLCFRTF